MGSSESTHATPPTSGPNVRIGAYGYAQAQLAEKQADGKEAPLHCWVKAGPGSVPFMHHSTVKNEEESERQTAIKRAKEGPQATAVVVFKLRATDQDLAACHESAEALMRSLGRAQGSVPRPLPVKEQNAHLASAAASASFPLTRQGEGAASLRKLQAQNTEQAGAIAGLKRDLAALEKLVGAPGGGTTVNAL